MFGPDAGRALMSGLLMVGVIIAAAAFAVGFLIGLAL